MAPLPCGRNAFSVPFKAGDRSRYHVYFFDFSFCERADPAAVFDALAVRPSFKVFDAAFAAFGLVSFAMMCSHVH